MTDLPEATHWGGECETEEMALHCGQFSPLVTFPHCIKNMWLKSILLLSFRFHWLHRGSIYPVF